MPSMLTTIDNPYDPRTDFNAWNAWDIDQGYNTCAYLDRVAVVSDDFPDAVQNQQIEEAMTEIVQLHNGALYKMLPIADVA